jgi:phage baseplate assembly protein W
MPDLWLEWEDDLRIDPTGDLVIATGWDEVRQRVVRQLLTNPQTTLADGTPVAADDVFDPSYGDGLRVLVGELANDQTVETIRQTVTNSLLRDPGVSPARLPQVTVTRTADHEITILIEVYLATGQPGRVALVLSR